MSTARPRSVIGCVGGKACRAMVALLGLGFAKINLSGAEAPAREKLEQGGWTIEFAPAERAVAEALARRVHGFEERFAAIAAKRPAFGRDEMQAATSDLAARAAEWSGQPERATVFEKALVEGLAQLKELQEQIDAALLVRSISIWRREEARAHFARQNGPTGAAGSRDDEVLGMRFRINVTCSYGMAPALTYRMETPTAIMLPIADEEGMETVVGKLVQDFDDWIKKIEHLPSTLAPDLMRMMMSLSLAKTIASDVKPEVSAQWISVGLSAWIWRQFVYGTLPPEAAKFYAAGVPALMVPRSGGAAINLEEWPAQDEDDGGHTEFALTLFCSIAERHGADAISRLLAEFWKRPLEQRTSAGLQAEYQRLLHEPLAALAPWRSLAGAAP